MKLIRLFYLSFFLVTLLSPVTWSNYNVLFSFFFIGIIYFLTKILNIEINVFQRTYQKFKVKNSIILFLFVLGVLLSNIVVKFYAGSNILESINNLGSSVSNYAYYQDYFKQNILGVSSFQKAPYILILMSLKILAFFSMFAFIYLKKIKYLILIIPLLLVNISRGTSIELFEIIFSYFFLRGFSSDKIKLFNFKIITLVSIFLFLFMYNIYVRTPELIDVIQKICYTSELCFDSEAQLFKYLPFLSIILYYLSGYFSFGTYYIFEYVKALYEENSLHYLIFGSWKFESSSYITCKYIDCGVNWEPDMIYIIHNFGTLFFVVIFYLLIKAFKKLIIKTFKEKNFYFFVFIYLAYFISMQLVSFPIGNLVVSSTPNILIVLSLTIIYFYRNVKIS